MDFKDKIDFLLRLSQTTNRQLASALMVDPSFISRLRSGKRNLPQKTAYNNELGSFFAKKLSTDYQKNALLEVIGNSALKFSNSIEPLSLAISDWLLEKETIKSINISQFISNVSKNDLKQVEQSNKEKDNAFKTNSHAYYGNEGKRNALRDFCKYLLSIKQPCTLLVSSDEDLCWLNEDISFIREFQKSIMLLSNNGYSFCRIYSKVFNANDPIESLNRWLPLYMIGKVTTFYCPRNRDNLYRKTMIVAPGFASICSSSIGNKPESNVTFLYIDADVANATAREFNDYLSRCLPMCTVHNHANDNIANCLIRYLKTPGNRINKNVSLPSYSSTFSVLKHVFPNDKKSIDFFSYLSSLNEDNLTMFEQTEIINLSPIEAIINGKVICSASRLIKDKEDVYYTPSLYIDHLKYLLFLLDKYPTYNIIISNDYDNKNIACAVENSLCYIIRDNNPFTIFEISEANFISSVSDYLLDIINENYYKTTSERNKTINTLTSFIEKIEKAK